MQVKAKIVFVEMMKIVIVIRSLKAICQKCQTSDIFKMNFSVFVILVFPIKFIVTLKCNRCGISNIDTLEFCNDPLENFKEKCLVHEDVCMRLVMEYEDGMFFLLKQCGTRNSCEMWRNNPNNYNILFCHECMTNFCNNVNSTTKEIHVVPVENKIGNLYDIKNGVKKYYGKWFLMLIHLYHTLGAIF